MSNEVKSINFGEVDVNVESRLNFQPDITINKGLCLGIITDVRIEEHDVPKVKDDGTISSWEFAGLKLHSLVIEFKQINADVKDTAERFLTYTEKIIGGKSNGEALDTKTWTDMNMEQFKRLQHIVNCLDRANVGTKSKKIANLSISPADTAEIRANKFKKMMEHFLKQIKGEGEKARYEGVVFWMRVVADYSTQKYYKLPDFVGQGFIEVVEKGKGSTIKLANNDTIELAVGKGRPAKDMNHTGGQAGNAAPAPASVDDVLANLGLNK